MAAHEEKNERVVLLRRSVEGLLWGADRLLCHFGLATPSGRFATNVVRHLPKGDTGKPCSRVLGNTVAGPLHYGGNRGLLNRVLGRAEVAKSPHYDSKHLRCQFPQQLSD